MRPASMRKTFVLLLVVAALTQCGGGNSTPVRYERVSAAGGYEYYEPSLDVWLPVQQGETSGSMTGPGNH
jgi:hypothetical protein